MRFYQAIHLKLNQAFHSQRLAVLKTPANYYYGGMLALLSVTALYWIVFLATPLSIKKEGLYLNLKPGTSITNLAHTLKQQGALDHPYLFIWLSRLKWATRSLQAGEYQIAQGTRPSQLIDQLVQGKVILYPLTIVEGWQFHQLLEALHKTPQLKHDTLKLSPKALRVKLHISLPEPHPKLKHKKSKPHALSQLEGRFFPNTYFFPYGATETEILQRAHQLMNTLLNQAWKQRDPDLPYTHPYQLLIVASMIEKETGLPDERKRIAGVITRRLKRGMKLQVDPTVIYGLGPHFKGRLKAKHLRIPSYYNTYQYPGLPPTPIALPSLEALKAAAHPSKDQSLYFVAKGDGSHYFSDTLSDHRQAVARYQKKSIQEKKT